MSKMEEALKMIDEQLEALEEAKQKIDILSRKEGHYNRLNDMFMARARMDGLLTAHYIIRMLTEKDEESLQDLETIFKVCYDNKNRDVIRR